MTAKKPLFNRPAWASSGKSTASTTTSSSVITSTPGPEDVELRPSTRSTPRKEKLVTGLEETSGKRQGPKAKSDAVVISLEDDDVPEDVVCTMAKSKWPPKTTKNTSAGKIETDKDAELFESDDDDDEDDPYLQELKAKAREKQQLEKLGLVEADKPKAASATAPSRPCPGHDPDPDPGTGPSPAITVLPLKEKETKPAQATVTPLSPPSVPAPPGPAPDDPEVSIYINPLIPNTKALIVGRKASQPLEPVKTFWCKKQNLSDAEAARVFFIWRDMKLYNSSTMQHILARLQKERKPGQKESEGKIVLEAVTQEIYDLKRDEQAAKKETAAASSFSHLSGGVRTEEREEERVGQPGGVALSEAKPPAVACTKFVIKLASKEYGELPIRIRPESTVRKIAMAFVQQMVAPQEGATNNKDAYLIFDGDRLENEQTAEEVGLEEGDVVEVQFR
ncbi:hypothetical protein DV736_g3663, partial [Chaetothyriales sp. CBS 134916]